jgi:leucyl-tRNA synthetase
MPHSKLLFARQMRKKPTRAEALLWARLRRKQTSVRWHRQALMLGWIVDFYCPTLKMVVELDGSFHTGREAYDAHRDAVIRAHGIRVLRFANEAVERDPGAVATFLTIGATKSPAAPEVAQREKKAVTPPSPVNATPGAPGASLETSPRQA